MSNLQTIRRSIKRSKVAVRDRVEEIVSSMLESQRERNAAHFERCGYLYELYYIFKDNKISGFERFATSLFDIKKRYVWLMVACYRTFQDVDRRILERIPNSQLMLHANRPRIAVALVKHATKMSGFQRMRGKDCERIAKLEGYKTHPNNIGTPGCTNVAWLKKGQKKLLPNEMTPEQVRRAFVDDMQESLLFLDEYTGLNEFPQAKIPASYRIKFNELINEMIDLVQEMPVIPAEAEGAKNGSG